MKVLLIVNQSRQNELRILVSLNNNILKQKVIMLMEENKGKEAFNLLKSKAEIEAYFPTGSKLSTKPDLTLIEDML